MGRKVSAVNCKITRSPLLSAVTVLPIYAAALNHKATKMAEGGQRKAAVAAAQTVEDVEAI